MKRILINTLISFLLLITIFSVSYKLDKVKPNFEVQEYLYISKYKKLREFAFGFEGEYSDYLWVLSLQGFHKHVLEGIKFHRIYEVYDLITDLDHYFKEAYNTGSLYIAIAKRDSLEGIRLLKEGTKKVANEAWIWRMLGRMYWLERHNLKKQGRMSMKEATRLAIESISKAYTLSHSEEDKILLRYLSFFDKIGTLDLYNWLKIYITAGKNKLLKTISQKRIQYHIVEKHLEYLQNIVKKFKKTYKRYPMSYKEIKNFAKIVPKEPQIEDIEDIIKDLIKVYTKYKKFNKIEKEIIKFLYKCNYPHSKDYIYLPKEHKVISYVLEEYNIPIKLRYIQFAINRYYYKYKKFPKDLKELIKERFLRKLPILPTWRKYKYNPKNGEVDVEFIEEYKNKKTNKN